MKILIVEDDKVQCKMYEEEIEAFNNEHNNKIEYVIKNNSKEALNIIESDFDAAIIDLNLREENENYSGNLVIQSIFEKKRIPIYIVSGTPNEYDPITALEGKKFFLTHGHLYDVKRSLNSIKEMAKKLKVNLVIFGHTHKPYIEYYEDEILFNPGATEDGRYGLIILKDGNIQLFHKQLQL